MVTKDVIFVPKDQNSELALATFGKFFEPKKEQEILIESTKFTWSLRINQSKTSYKGRLRRNQSESEFFFHETDRVIYVYELDH